MTIIPYLSESLREALLSENELEVNVFLLSLPAATGVQKFFS